MFEIKHYVDAQITGTIGGKWVLNDVRFDRIVTSTQTLSVDRVAIRQNIRAGGHAVADIGVGAGTIHLAHPQAQARECHEIILRQPLKNRS